MTNDPLDPSHPYRYEEEEMPITSSDTNPADSAAAAFRRRPRPQPDTITSGSSQPHTGSGCAPASEWLAEHATDGGPFDSRHEDG